MYFNFIMVANTMNPDQTAPLLREQSDLDPYCLQYRLPYRGKSRISRKVVHRYKGMGIRFADFISLS